MKINNLNSLYDWIPVSETLPKTDGYYLVTVQGKYVNNSVVEYSNYFDGKFDAERVIAWKDLPLPYPYNQPHFC